MIYGILCLYLIKLSQWAFNNSSAVWLATVSTFIFTIDNIFSKRNSIITPVFVAVLLLLSISLIIKKEEIRKWLMKKYLKYRFELSTIAILDGRIFDTDVNFSRPEVRYSAQNWKDELERQGLPVELISISKITRKYSKKYSMIINPFGSHYIEEDFTNLKTFRKIKDYIHWGGVFVNTWNIAFWESWNSIENKKFHTSSGVESYLLKTSPLTIEEFNRASSEVALLPIISGSSLLDTLLQKEFGVHTTSFEQSVRLRTRPVAGYLRDIEEYTLTEFRSALNCEGKNMTFFKLISAQINQTYECYPVSGINNYIGYLILFGTDITNNDDLNFECRVIKKIFDRLNQCGTL